MAALAMVALLLVDTATMAEAYGCKDASLCDAFDDADVVLDGDVMARSEDANEYGDHTYTFMTHFPYYKTEPGVGGYGYEVFYTSHSSSVLCGLDLELGERYIIGFYRHSEQLTAYSCGLLIKWSSMTDEEKAALEAGCIENLCDEVCDEYETCMEYPSGSGVFRCMELCVEGACADGETCTLDDDQLTAKCTPSSDGT